MSMGRNQLTKGPQQLNHFAHCHPTAGANSHPRTSRREEGVPSMLTSYMTWGAQRATPSRQQGNARARVERTWGIRCGFMMRSGHTPFSEKGRSSCATMAPHTPFCPCRLLNLSPSCTHTGGEE